MKRGPAARASWIARVVCLGCAVSSAQAATLPRVEASLARSEATVGERVELRIEVHAAAGARVAPPEIARRLGPFTVTPRGWEAISQDGPTQLWRWRGELAAFRTGDLEVPGVEIAITGEDQADSVLLRSEPLTLSIRSVLDDEADDAELADLKDPASIAPDLRPLWIALGVVAALLALSTLAWWLQRRYGARLAASPAPDPFDRMPPHEWAFRALQHLLEQRLPEQGKVDAFFDELSTIVKRYLSGRYRVDLPERTTDEVPEVLRQAGAEQRQLQAVRELLRQCDLVKFARAGAEPAACRAAVEKAYRIVDSTRPADLASDGERGAA